MPAIQLGELIGIARLAVAVAVILAVILIVKAVSYDVDDAEAGSRHDFNIRLVRVLGKHVSACAAFDEINMLDQVSLVEYILALRSDCILEQWTNP